MRQNLQRRIGMILITWKPAWLATWSLHHKAMETSTGLLMRFCRILVVLLSLIIIIIAVLLCSQFFFFFFGMLIYTAEGMPGHKQGVAPTSVYWKTGELRWIYFMLLNSFVTMYIHYLKMCYYNTVLNDFYSACDRGLINRNNILKYLLRMPD